MSIYFIENEYGEYCSWDGKRRFIKLTGKQAYYTMMKREFQQEEISLLDSISD